MDTRPTILVVEDEILIRLVTSEGLRDDGYHVIEAANADEAKAILATPAVIHLVMTDINMPGSINGLELAAEIKAADPSLPVILVSSHLPETSASQADAFIAKPFLHSELSDAVARLIGPEWKTRAATGSAS